MTNWDSSASLVDHLGAMVSVQLEGVGFLTSPPVEERASGRSGKVRFVLEHRLEETDHPYGESRRATLTGLDDQANTMLQHRSSTSGVPLPLYSLEGTLTKPTDGVPLRLESVILDPIP